MSSIELCLLFFRYCCDLEKLKVCSKACGHPSCLLCSSVIILMCLYKISLKPANNMKLTVNSFITHGPRRETTNSAFEENKY